MSIAKNNQVDVNDLINLYTQLNNLLQFSNITSTLPTTDLTSEKKINASDINQICNKFDAMKQDAYLSTVSSMFSTYSTVTSRDQIVAKDITPITTTLKTLTQNVVCKNTATNSNGTTDNSHGTSTNNHGSSSDSNGSSTNRNGSSTDSNGTNSTTYTHGNGSESNSYGSGTFGNKGGNSASGTYTNGTKTKSNGTGTHSNGTCSNGSSTNSHGSSTNGYGSSTNSNGSSTNSHGTQIQVTCINKTITK